MTGKEGGIGLDSDVPGPTRVPGRRSRTRSCPVALLKEGKFQEKSGRSDTSSACHIRGSARDCLSTDPPTVPPALVLYRSSSTTRSSPTSTQKTSTQTLNLPGDSPDPDPSVPRVCLRSRIPRSRGPPRSGTGGVDWVFRLLRLLRRDFSS